MPELTIVPGRKKACRMCCRTGRPVAARDFAALVGVKLSRGIFRVGFQPCLRASPARSRRPGDQAARARCRARAPRHHRRASFSPRCAARAAGRFYARRRIGKNERHLPWREDLGLLAEHLDGCGDLPGAAKREPYVRHGSRCMEMNGCRLGSGDLQRARRGREPPNCGNRRDPFFGQPVLDRQKRGQRSAGRACRRRPAPALGSIPFVDLAIVHSAYGRSTRCSK